MTTINNKILLGANSNFKKIAKDLYTENLTEVIERFTTLVTRHSSWCLGESFFFSSPGRIEIIGNHTDHNNGEVLAATISLDTLAIVTPNDEMQIIIKSEGFDDVIVDINDLECKEEEKGSSQALVRGVLKGFINKGYSIGGFFSTTTSTVMKGSGVSSSAAFEVLVSEILNQLYNNGSISPKDKAIISRFAENNYFGKPSGLMDQLTIALGGVSRLDFKDQENPIITTLTWNFNKLSIFIINCGGDHSDLTKHYASIKTEMVSIANYFGQNNLRGVDRSEFMMNIKNLKQAFNGRSILRAMHFYDENLRVANATEFLKNGDDKKFLDAVRDSGISSYTKLQNIYVEGDPSEPIPLALAIINSVVDCNNNKFSHACRIHGGGFAGTVLAIVPNLHEADFINTMTDLYGKENVFKVKIRKSGAIKLDL
ncbi:MAG: galactokinase [Christensenellaceae bacterium]|jgi:galactokinase|nr:galactokinase [Christensenellaceae bacterium]